MLKWYDHNAKRPVRALCVVDVALVIQGQALFILPYLLLETKKPPFQQTTKKTKITHEQDAKTEAVITLVSQIIRELEEMHVQRRKIGVLVDAWYSNRQFMDFVRATKVKYRIAGKKNYQVHLPNHKRIQRRKNGGRGRRPTRYVKTRRLDDHFKTIKKGGTFLDSRTSKRVRWQEATVTLDTGGRTRVFAFWRAGCKEPIYIFTPISKILVSRPETVYRDYGWRWRVEECHRDLKQQFGLGKLRNRLKGIVQGFLGIIYGLYSLFLLIRDTTGQIPTGHITAPQYQDTLFSILFQQKGVRFG